MSGHQEVNVGNHAVFELAGNTNVSITSKAKQAISWQ